MKAEAGDVYRVKTMDGLDVFYLVVSKVRDRIYCFTIMQYPNGMWSEEDFLTPFRLKRGKFFSHNETSRMTLEEFDLMEILES